MVFSIIVLEPNIPIKKIKINFFFNSSKSNAVYYLALVHQVENCRTEIILKNHNILNYSIVKIRNKILFRHFPESLLGSPVNNQVVC